MTTANLSVGINTKPAKANLAELKSELTKLKVVIPVTVDTKAIASALSGTSFKVKIDAADLSSQVRRAVQDGVKGVKLSAGSTGSAELTQLKAGFTQVQQTVGALSAEIGKIASAGAVTQLTSATKQLGNAHKDATIHTKTHAEAMRDAHSAARGLASGFGAMWLTWGNLAPLLAGASLSHGFIQAMKAGTEFAYQLTFVKALGGETADSVRGIGSAALELSKNGLFGPVELANGLRTLSQAGLNAVESMKALPTVLDLATVGEMSMKDAAITLVGVMTAFNLQTSDMTHIGDVFAKAAAVSQTSVEQMTQAMKTASVVGDQYGASMEDTATALTLLAKVNITGTAAGTSLRNMLKELYSPSQKAAEIMKDLGVSAQTATGELRPFPDVIFSLQKNLEGFNKASQVKILQGLFGERGAKEAVAMLSLTREEWEKLNRTVSESAGFMREVSAELEGTVKGSFKQAINTLQASMIEAYNNAEGEAGKLAGQLKETFGSAAFKESLTAIVAGVSSITNALVAMAPALAMAAGGWVALRAAMIGAAVWTSVTTALSGATLAVQTLGAVAAGAATTLTGSTGLLAAARMLPGVMGAAGASLLATTGVLGPLAVAIGVAGTAWYLFRDRTVEAMQQSADAVAQGAASMRTNLANILRDVHNLPAAASRKAMDAQRQVLVDNQNKLLEQRESLKKTYGIKSDAEAKEFSNRATSVHPVTGEVYTETGAKYDAVNAYLQAQATQKVLLKEFSKLNQTIESVAESEKKPEVTVTPTNLKNWAGVGGGRASREAGKLENAEIKNVLKDQAAIEKLYDTHYKRLIDLENASAQAGLITREQAEDKVTKLTEEQLNARMEINKNYHSALQEMLKTAKDLTPAQREQLTGEIERRGILLLELREELDYKKQIAEINRLGAEKRFNDNINKNNVELTKELEIAKAAVYGKITNPVDRARDNGETLVSNRYAQMIQEAVDARIQAEQSGNEAAIKATAERLELLDQEVQKSKQYYGDQYAALAEYQQTASYGWDKFWEKYEENATTAAKVVEQSLESVTKNIEDAFADMFKTGKFDAKKMVDSILSDVGRLVAKLAVSDLGNLFFGKGKPSGDVLGSIFGMGGNKEGGGIQSEGLSGLLTKATEGLKGFWDSLTGATSATIESTAKTVEDVLTMGTKKVAETSSTAALTELAAAAQMAATSLSMVGSTGGGGGGGILSGLFGAIGGSGTSAASATADFVPYAWANGGAFRNGIQAFAKGGTFSNSIVRQPTLFRFADGTGMMGEAGPEAIMPLTRDSQGRLGVRYEGREAPQSRGNSNVSNNNINVTVNSKSGDPAEIRRSGAAVARQVASAVAGSGRYR